MTNDAEENSKTGGSEADSKVTSFEEKFLLLLIEDALEVEAVESFPKDDEFVDSLSEPLD